MSVITSQQTSRYYDEFGQIDVTFTREVIKATLLYPKQIFIKCLGYQWPCIMYSSSMRGAKIIVNIQNSFKQILEKANNTLSLRYSFIQRDKPDPISFFVNAKIVEYAPYSADNPDLSFISLVFTNKPSDDLINRLGALLEAHSSAQNRREERINITVESTRDMNLVPKSTQVFIDHVPRKCIVRDIAYSGAKVIIMGVAKFLVNKPAALHVEFTDPDEAFDLAGKVIRFEPIEGRQDIGAFIIQFEETVIPVEYKMRLTTYLKQHKNKKPTQATE